MGKLEETELNALLEHFSLEKKSYSLKSINDGYINDTYLVLDGDVPTYILQRINHEVFKDVEGLMGNIENGLEHLNDTDYSPIKLVRTKLGKTFFEYTGKGYWRLMTFIDQSTTYNTTTDRKIAYEAGRIIGKFHSLLQNAQVSDFVDTIPRFHDLQLRKTQFEKAVASSKKEKLITACSAIDFAKKTFPKLENPRQLELPIRICHNDTKLNNILFSEKDTKGLCLIDLDTLMKGYFYYDFGDAVRTIANTAKEDEREHGKITFEKELFEAFVDGLGTNASFLTQKEIQSLHLGVVFMPFIHGLRALTDYLEDNKYYKASYENQNLDRCLSLFDFTEKALAELDDIKTVLRKKLMPLKG